KPVAVGVELHSATDNQIVPYRRGGQIPGLGLRTRSSSGTRDPVVAVTGNIIEKLEALYWLSLHEYQLSLVENRVAGNPHLAYAIKHLQKAACSPGAAKADKEVIVDVYPGCRLTWPAVVVPTQKIEAASYIAHDVMTECDILHHSPGHGAALVAHGKQDGKSILAIGPVVLQKISFYKYSTGILELEDVLD